MLNESLENSRHEDEVHEHEEDKDEEGEDEEEVLTISTPTISTELQKKMSCRLSQQSNFTDIKKQRRSSSLSTRHIV